MKKTQMIFCPIAIGLVILLVSCAATPKVKVSVYYPNTEGKRFDVEYYRDKHMPLADKLLKPYGLIETGIEKGIAGGEPNQPAPYICIGYMTWESVDDFQEGFGVHAPELFADVPNFTNIEPMIQISAIVK
jgi:uncharacterized protein (TIGR02118 family)